MDEGRIAPGVSDGFLTDSIGRYVLDKLSEEGTGTYVNIDGLLNDLMDDTVPRVSMHNASVEIGQEQC